MARFLAVMAQFKIAKDHENTPLHGLDRFVPFWPFDKLRTGVGGGWLAGGDARTIGGD
jgi:hypothetical protein